MSDCKGNNAKSTCVECEVPQLARNHYFTGKLLVERDFTDEQRYFVGKDRRHNQQLHGWGTICGLRVKQHPNEACQDQYVLIEPGTAIDCCGRELLVRRMEYFDFRTRFEEIWKEQNGRDAEPDNKPHTLSICLSYRECGTEEVPALFDDCGCDETACQPNRVLESYQLDLLIDKQQEKDEPYGVDLIWCCTINVAHARRLALDEEDGRLYILASDAAAATLYAVSTANEKVIASVAFSGQDALDLAVAPDGTRLYVALRAQGGATNPQILVLDTAKLADPAINTLTFPTDASEVSLAVAPDGRLYATDAVDSKVRVWATDINTGGSPAAPKDAAVESNPVAISIGRDGLYAYVANEGSGTVSAVKTADLSVTSIPVASGAKPSALSVATTTAGDNIAVVDTDNEKLYLIGWRPDEANASDRVKPLGDPVTGLEHRPVAITSSSGGKWLYVLEKDDADQKGYVQPVDAHAVELKAPDALGDAFPVGDNPQSVALTADHTRLYAAYDGDGAADAGGVSALKVSEQSCADIFSRVLDDCPTCKDASECVVLATIKDYVYGDKVVEGAPQNGQAQIDNLTGRHLLPSTEIITDVLKCLLEKGGGGMGQRGEQGPPGTPGTSVKSADAETVSPGSPAEASFDSNTGNIHFKIPKGDKGDQGLDGTSVKSADAESVAPTDPADAAFNPATGNIHFKIPKGEKGDPGAPGTFPTLDLPHIVAINWPHAGAINISRARDRKLFNEQLNKLGLVVAFDKEMLPETINNQTFQVLVRKPQDDGTFCYCNVSGDVQPVEVIVRDPNNPAGGGVKPACGVIIEGVRDQSNVINGARFFPNSQQQPFSVGRDYWVVIRGDFILGKDKIMLPDGREVNPALDGDHLGPGLPNPLDPAQPNRCPTGDGIEGGTFESWFSIIRGGR